MGILNDTKPLDFGTGESEMRTYTIPQARKWQP